MVLAWLEFYNSILLTDPPDGWGRVLMMMREEEEMVLVLFHAGFISSCGYFQSNILFQCL